MIKCSEKSRWGHFLPPATTVALVIIATIFIAKSSDKPPDLQWRYAGRDLIEADATAIWGRPGKVVQIDDIEVWSYDKNENAGIAFKGGKCVKSNLIYDVAPNGSRYPSDRPSHASR
jgi:hypothetical protein